MSWGNIFFPSLLSLLNQSYECRFPFNPQWMNIWPSDCIDSDQRFEEKKLISIEMEERRKTDRRFSFSKWLEGGIVLNFFISFLLILSLLTHQLLIRIIKTYWIIEQVSRADGRKVAWQLLTERKRSKKVKVSPLKRRYAIKIWRRKERKYVNRRRKKCVKVQDLIVFKNDDWFPNEEGKKKVREESKWGQEILSL